MWEGVGISWENRGVEEVQAVQLKIAKLSSPNIGRGRGGHISYQNLINLYFQILYWLSLCQTTNYYTPRERSSGGYIEITLSVCLSICLSVCADSCPAHNFFMVWHWLTIFGTWVYHHGTMCRVHSWSRYDLELWPQGQIYRVFDMFLCPAHNFFMVWHWLTCTIFGTWMYHHETMCRVH